MSRINRNIIIGLATALFAIPVLGTGGCQGGGEAHAATQHHNTNQRPHGRCFPANIWSGPGGVSDGLRPCVQVTRVYEDGSFEVRVSDANGTVRYTRGVGVPNRYEWSH